MTETAVAPIAEAFDLSQEAILMRLSVSQGNLTASSSVVVRDAAAANNAEADALYGGVQVLRKEDRAEIISIVGQARTAFHARTLGWDEPYRLCPLTAYPALKSKLEEYSNNFTDAVEKLASRYDELRATYEAKLGALSASDLSVEKRFPSEAALRSGFSFSVSALPLTNPNDFRLKHVDQATVSALRAGIEAAMTDRLGAANMEIVSRLRDLVQTVASRTKNPDGRIYDSLVTNIQEAVSVLPTLNVTGDAEIARLISRVRTELAGIDVKGLRTSRTYRAATAEAAGSVLDDLKSYGL